VPNPYDELPYKSLPIEWTAPERLALASLLRGGPRPRLDEYRVLELGCADGANLLPLGYFRPHARFLGIDGAQSQIGLANTRRAALGLHNVEFVCADFRAENPHIYGKFDFIIAHGVFSWVSDAAREAVLELCTRHLSADGLFYLNYNTYPGWNVRGMIRRLLLARTDGGGTLGQRALLAQETAVRLADSMASGDHPFTRLLINELRFVAEHHHSYVAHEYLAEHNRAFWRSEFLQLIRGHGFQYVGDADFSYPSGRISVGSASAPVPDDMCEDPSDTADLLCYRQLHSPILCRGPREKVLPTTEEFADLTIASCLSCGTREDGAESMFHPSGFKVEMRDAATRDAFARLQSCWPQGLRIADVFQDVGHVMDDLKLLQRHGLVELRCQEPDTTHQLADLPHEVQDGHADYVTTPYHTREAVPVLRKSKSACGPASPSVA
jgi:ubiquinone/menaquinone biosynthesis C-methylase UbiE